MDHEFLDALGIKVSDGRNFRADDETREIGAYIFNETARRQFDIKLGEEIDGDEIIGFIPDINFASMRQSITPMAFFMFGKNHWGGVYQSASIRVAAGSDLRAARQAVEDCLRSFDPEYPFNVRFYDSILEDTYQKEQRTGSLITLFSLVAIFISIVGVFSLVVFDCEYRRKEIAVRKVLGSSEAEVTGMFCRSYMVMLAVCFVIGAPLAWLAVDRWLESFAYRTPPALVGVPGRLRGSRRSHPAYGNRAELAGGERKSGKELEIRIKWPEFSKKQAAGRSAEPVGAHGRFHRVHGHHDTGPPRLEVRQELSRQRQDVPVGIRL